MPDSVPARQTCQIWSSLQTRVVGLWHSAARSDTSMLLLLLLAHHALAVEVPKQTNYVMKNIEFCPHEGYFFKKDMGKSNHPGPCYLCFCREHNKAICWPRENKRCDVEHYHYHGMGKREARARRSPAGLSDIFFRDGVRDLFNKNTPETCKPFESSYSVGCPPSDWCIGCTVCDCDANGRWDCHLLSFCPEKEQKKKKNMHRGPKGPYGKNRVYRRKNSIADNTAMVKIKSNGSSKTSKISPVKKQSKKIQISKPKRNPQVRKNPASQRPQIKQSIAKSRSSQIVKSPATKRSQEIRKGTSVRRNQAVNKSLVKKSSPIKKKAPLNMTGGKKIMKMDGVLKKTKTVKVPVVRTPTPKKPPPVKLTTENKTKANNKQQQPVKRSPNAKPTETRTKQPMPRKMRLTTRPVILNSKVMPPKKGVTTKKTTALPLSLTSKDIQHIGQEVVKTFMSAINRAIEKNIPKQGNNKSGLGKQDSVDGSHKRPKRQDGEITNFYLRPKRSIGEGNFTVEYNTTTPMNNVNTTELATNIVEIVSERLTTTLNSSWNTYYKYSVEDLMENSTEPVKITVGIVNVTDVPKNGSVKRSLKEGVIDVTKAQNSKITPIKLIMNYKPLSQLTKPILTTAYTSPLKLTTNKQIMPMNYNDANDLKFNKWSEENLLKINEQNILKALSGNMTSIVNIPINITEPFKKIKSSRVTRKLGMVHRKYKLKKILNTLQNKTKKFEKFNLSNRHLHKKKTNTSEFSFFVTNVLNGFNKKNITKVANNNANKFRIMKYLQKIFKKMFHSGAHKNKSAKNRTAKIAKLNKDSVLETLCESFGPCYIDIDVKQKLHSKIDDLNTETNRMLVTIKTIKGLLKLIDFAKNDKKLEPSEVQNTKSNFKDDIHKLSAILKGTYVEQENLDKLTQTQQTQIEYIKRNTHIFIQSTSKFAKILNDIIDIINRSHANMRNGGPRRISRSHENLDERNKNAKNTLGFDKVKDLLVKYNVLQNQFVQKMYQIVSKLEPPAVTVKPKVIKPVEYKEFDKDNRTAAIQIYANNIIKNLRKLKYLAQNLSIRNRRKRDLRDDDSMEYLLVLMEYLLKQNYPLDTSPVNDGIDLLIDAIKHAPDIKTIKKKVLLNNAIRTSNVTNATSIEVDVSSDDSTSDMNKLSKEVNFTSQQDDSKFNLIEESLDNDSDLDYKYLSNRKTNVRVTTKPDPDMIEYTPTELVEGVDEVTEIITEVPIRNVAMQPSKTASTKSYNKDLVKDNTVDAASSEEKEGEAKYIIKRTFDRITEDDDVILVSTKTDEIQAKGETETTTPVTKAQIVFDVEKIRHYDKDDISLSRSGDKKYLDWLDESFEEEYKTEANITESLKKKAVTSKKSLESTSSLSKDSFEVEKKDETEDVMYKKEMNLLNSLDYGMPQHDSENSDSKETSEYKYGSDTIPAYFA